MQDLLGHSAAWQGRSSPAEFQNGVDFIRIELEIRVLSAVNKLHRSSVETIAACLLPAPTYDLHVAQFYGSVVR